MKKGRKKKRHIGFRIFVGFQILLMALVLGAVAFYYFSGLGEQISAMQKEARELVEASTEETFRAVETSLVYDANGQQISALKGEKDVYYLESEEIPAYVKAAIISIEDKKFYNHPGYDLEAILRAAKAYLDNGEVTQGGSTITQQLARGIFLTSEKTWQRKVEEIFVAVELEGKYSKEDVLEFYLNNIYFANGYYGIGAASYGYFSKPVEELSLSEIAFLCAIPNNPTLYDPTEQMENTLKRRNRILDQMRIDGKITEATYTQAVNEGIVLNQTPREKYDYVETYTWYCASRALMELQGFQFQTEFASEEERADYQERYEQLYTECQSSLYRKGYRIYTSIDMEMQKSLQNSVDRVLSGYTETNEEGVYALQGSAVCIDNHNGMVKAIVGGRDQKLTGYTLNRAYQSFRQPGSAIKPLLVYTPALERGYVPDSPVLDEEIEDGPQNADGVFEGEMTLRQAVEKSKNTVAWSLLEELSPETGLNYLKAMNFARLSEEDVQLPAALGGFTTGASALEMATGYATIQNDGKYRQPTCILTITDSDGNVIYEASQSESPVYQQNAARMMTDIMRGVLTEGTGAGLALEGMPAVGKTGTTNSRKDGWFVGFTRYYTTSVWVGYDMPRELPGLSGASYPGMIWKQFMEEAHEGLAPLNFLPYIKAEEPEEEETSPEDEEPVEGEPPPEGQEPVEEETPTEGEEQGEEEAPIEGEEQGEEEPPTEGQEPVEEGTPTEGQEPGEEEIQED